MESERAVAVADARAAMMVGEGMSTPTGRMEETAAMVEERMLVGVAFSRREDSEGSKPGGGSMSCVWRDRVKCWMCVCREGEDKSMILHPTVRGSRRDG